VSPPAVTSFIDRTNNQNKSLMQMAAKPAPPQQQMTAALKGNRNALKQSIAEVSSIENLII